MEQYGIELEETLQKMFEIEIVFDISYRKDVSEAILKILEFLNENN